MLDAYYNSMLEDLTRSYISRLYNGSLPVAFEVRKYNSAEIAMISGYRNGAVLVSMKKSS